MDKAVVRPHPGAMGSGGLTSVRVQRWLGALVAVLAATSVVALLTVTPTWPSVTLGTIDRVDHASVDQAQPGVDLLQRPAGSTAPASVLPGSVAGPDTTRPATSSAPAAGSTQASGPTTGSGATAGPPSPAGGAAADTGLWVADGGTPLRRSSPDAGWVPLAWSPDSHAVALARSGEVELLEPASGSRRPLLATAGMTALHGAWSPDGRSLAVELAGTPYPRLLEVEVATGTVTEHPIHSTMTNLAYTPNGCLAFADSFGGEDGIAVLCPGQARRVVPLHVGALVAVLGSTGFAYTREGPSGISVADFQGRPLPGVTGTSNLYGNELAWDATDGMIIWRGGTDGAQARLGIYATRLGGATTAVSSCSASSPTASTNGTLVYAEGCGTAPAVLLRRSGPTGPAQAVATIPHSRMAAPLLSPDGRWLLVAVSPF